MNISKISFFNANSHQNFSGTFREVDRSSYTDQEQRCEITNVHAIYHPNKYESEREIRMAMDRYNKKSDGSDGGRVLDGGVDRYGRPTETQGWSSSTYYSCERGERLPY